MIEKTSDTEAAKEKFGSGSEQARKAWEATAEAAKNVGNAVRKEANEAFTTGKDHLGKAVHSFGEAASETYGAFRGQATETAQACREKAKSALEDVSTSVKNMQAKTEEYIRTYPLKSVGMAIGVGIFLAALLRRR